MGQLTARAWFTVAFLVRCIRESEQAREVGLTAVCHVSWSSCDLQSLDHFQGLLSPKRLLPGHATMRSRHCDNAGHGML